MWNSKLGSIRPQVAILIWFPQSSLPRKIFNSCSWQLKQKTYSQSDELDSFRNLFWKFNLEAINIDWNLYTAIENFPILLATFSLKTKPSLGTKFIYLYYRNNFEIDFAFIIYVFHLSRIWIDLVVFGLFNWHRVDVK